MKRYLKILAAVASAAVLWLGYSIVSFLRDEDRRCNMATVTGDISAETFVKLRGCLERSQEPKKTFVIMNSPGGDSAAALALGILIHRHDWDVEIVDYCASACANFIFTAGKTKYLDRHAMLLFHGGPDQENLLAMATPPHQGPPWKNPPAAPVTPETTQQGPPMRSAPARPLTLGQEGKENTITVTPTQSPADKEVRRFLSIAEDANLLGLLMGLRKASDQFYQELGINPLLPSYGQLGDYEPVYRSYEYLGFIYRLDSLRSFGIRNIELKEGEWHPERHPKYKDVYEVTYP